MRLPRLVAILLALLAWSTPAAADVTAFIGTTTTPSSRTASGFAIGAGLLIVGFEFEYANTREDEAEPAPRLRTGVGNILFQTPIEIARMQFYFTTGGGAYRETLGAHQETNFAVNTGGGVKIGLAGPLRARVDYRVFKLRGSPLHSTVNRLYVGLNLKF